MKKYDCIMFDLDGTLMDTSSGILNCLDFIVEQFHLVPLSDQEKHCFIGPPIQESFQKHYSCSQERAWELAVAWREAYKEKFLLRAEPYDGIYDLLHKLRQAGIKTGIATNKREDYTLKLLKYFSFLSLFDCIVGSDFAGKRSKVDIICMCMKQIGVTKAERCLMVGDTIGDFTAAQKAGVDFLGVTYGFGFVIGQSIPNHKMANSCGEIRAAIEDK